jgi:hypothetical protein
MGFGSGGRASSVGFYVEDLNDLSFIIYAGSTQIELPTAQLPIE